MKSHTNRRRRAPRQRVGFGEWFANLTTFGKLRLALLVLLIIWLIGIAAPWAFLSMLQGSVSAGNGSDDLVYRSNLFNAISEVYAIGSYELAARDPELAEMLALADRQAPPTATTSADRDADPGGTPLPRRRHCRRIRRCHADAALHSEVLPAAAARTGTGGRGCSCAFTQLGRV